MTHWFAPYAWLGGSSFARDVTVEVIDGLIAAVVADSTPLPTATRLEGVMLPGFVNAHSHAFHRLLRGRTHESSGDFWRWRDAMYTIAQRLEPDSYRALATEVFGEMLRAGITTVGEFHYVHHQPNGRPYPEAHAMELAMIGAATDAGIRLTLLDTCYLASDVDGTPPRPEQMRFADPTADAWSGRVIDLAGRVDLPTVKIGTAAHSVRAVPARALALVGETARKLSSPVHVHLSEQRAENAACVAHLGVTPARLLFDAGLLDANATTIHGTHLTAADQDLLGSSGSGVCFCPTTERELGDGIGPARELRDLAVPISLGTDSNSVIDMIEEARSLEMNDRLRLERRGVHAPADLLASATVTGLSALGWGTHAALGVGSPADFVTISFSHISTIGLEPSDGPGALLFAASGSAITDVVVAGKLVVAEGENLRGQSPAGLHRSIREMVT